MSHRLAIHLAYSTGLLGLYWGLINAATLRGLIGSAMGIWLIIPFLLILAVYAAIFVLGRGSVSSCQVCGRKKGKFTLDDFRRQINQIAHPGLLKKLLGLMPGMGELNKMLQGGDREEEMKCLLGIIDAMTPAERIDPKRIDNSRRERIAQEAGVSLREVNTLIQQFEIMASMMGSSSAMDMMQKMRSGEMIYPSGESKEEFTDSSQRDYDHLPPLPELCETCRQGFYDDWPIASLFWRSAGSTILFLATAAMVFATLTELLWSVPLSYPPEASLPEVTGTIQVVRPSRIGIELVGQFSDHQQMHYVPKRLYQNLATLRSGDHVQLWLDRGHVAKLTRGDDRLITYAEYQQVTLNGSKLMAKFGLVVAAVLLLVFAFGGLTIWRKIRAIQQQVAECRDLPRA